MKCTMFTIATVENVYNNAEVKSSNMLISWIKYINELFNILQENSTIVKARIKL